MATSLEHIGHSQSGTSRGHAALAALLPQSETTGWDWLPRLPGWLDPLSTVIALKTGVGLVIAMAIALWLDWSPTGAAFAVIMLQTTYLGRTLGRSVLRAVGAVAGALLALTLVATFVQERVLMISAAALVTGVIIYLEQLSDYPYALLFIALSVNLITFGSIYDPENAFSEAVSWVSGNGLGIAVVLIMHGVLWPHTGEKAFEKQLRTFLQGLSHLFALKTAALVESPAEPGKPAGDATPEVRELEAHLVAALAQLRLALGIASRDTERIARFSPAYAKLIEQLQTLTSALIMYGETLRIWRDRPLAGELAQHASAPGELIQTIQAQLDDLVAGCDQARDGSELPKGPGALGIIKEQLASLRELVAARPRSALQAATLDVVSEKAIETSAAISAARQAMATLEQPGQRVAGGRAQIDMITRIRSPGLLLQKSVIGMIAVTVASLLWINLDWPEPSSLLVFVVVPVALNAMVPKFPLMGALKSLFCGPAIAAVLYFGVMPRIDGMWQLAPILILFFFPTAYLTNSSNPSTMIFGLFSSLWIVNLIDLSEGQVYSFADFANTAIGIIGGVAVALATLAFINPPVPEHQFKTHVRAFLARCERAVEDLSRAADASAASTLAVRRAEWLELLSMCELWAHQLEERRHRASERARLGAFIETLWALAFRLEALAQAHRRHPDESLIATPCEHCREAIIATLRALQGELETGGPAAPGAGTTATTDAFRGALEPLHARHHASFGDRNPLHQALTLAGYYCALHDEVETCSKAAAEIAWRRWDRAYF